MSAILPLEGLYLRLVSAGMPISVRDYQDVLFALRSGDGLHSREELHWLCETLWARTDQEVALLARLFRDLPRPSVEQIDALTGATPISPSSSAPSSTKDSPKRPEADAAAAQTETTAPAVEFGTPGQTGIGLPRAIVTLRGHGTFILAPRPLITLRSLIIAWRRFRLAQRSGPKVELDIDATVDQQCRRGSLVEPVLVPARRNQARLVVLVDTSPSMVIWAQTTKLLVESLAASHFAEAPAYYFDNSPDDTLFERETLTRPVSLATILERHPQSSLIVVGDAGAARSKRNQERVRQLRTFADSTKEAWPRAAWLNPMPRARWKDTSAASVAQLIRMFELTDDGLISAVDYLRGKLTGFANV